MLLDATRTQAAPKELAVSGPAVAINIRLLRS
jgi:hypothetical protein